MKAQQESDQAKKKKKKKESKSMIFATLFEYYKYVCFTPTLKIN